MSTLLCSQTSHLVHAPFKYRRLMPEQRNVAGPTCRSIRLLCQVCKFVFSFLPYLASLEVKWINSHEPNLFLTLQYVTVFRSVQLFFKWVVRMNGRATTSVISRIGGQSCGRFQGNQPLGDSAH